MKRLALLFLTAGCGDAPPDAPALPFQTLGSFEHTARMTLPEEVTRWNGVRVLATGFMNPTTQARDLTTFLLVKDQASCCFGKRPQMNHFIEVKLKPEATTHYTRDPVSVRGVLTIGERWDGDWLLGVYWMEGAEVVK